MNQKLRGELSNELTEKESLLIEILVNDCMSRKQAASFLKISEYTVEAHLRRIYEKLNVSTVLELSRWYYTERVKS